MVVQREQVMVVLVAHLVPRQQIMVVQATLLLTQKLVVVLVVQAVLVLTVVRTPEVVMVVQDYKIIMPPVPIAGMVGVDLEVELEIHLKVVPIQRGEQHHRV